MRRTAGLIATGVLALGVGACNGDDGEANTVEAFCSEAGSFRDAFEQFEQRVGDRPEAGGAPEQLAGQLRPVVGALDAIMAAADDMLDAAPDEIAEDAETLQSGIQQLFGEYQDRLQEIVDNPEIMTEDPERAAELVRPPELEQAEQARFDEAGDTIRAFTLEQCNIDLENLGDE